MERVMGIIFRPESIAIASFTALMHLRYPHRYPKMVAVTPLFGVMESLKLVMGHFLECIHKPNIAFLIPADAMPIIDSRAHVFIQLGHAPTYA